MNQVKNKLVVAGILAGSLALVGCETMHGLGEDISSGGKALSRAAEPSKKSSKTTKTEASKGSQTSSSG